MFAFRDLPLKPAYANEEEDLAARYLRQIGFTVLSRNDRRFGAELDILCGQKDEGELFIFEVKRAPRRGSEKYPRLSARQRVRLKKAAAGLQVAADKFITVRISLLLIDRQTNEVEIIWDI